MTDCNYVLLSTCTCPGQTSSLGRSHNRNVSSRDRLPNDEKVGFDAAVAALAIKSNVSESEHPLLCEGIRRQKGELSTTLLVHYKDDQSKLRKVSLSCMYKNINYFHHLHLIHAT